MNGRTLQESVMMMIPEAWQNHESMSEEKRAFYEYHSCLMEPWDGPASIVFTDGKYIGAVLDRNGLRPSRYYLTHDDRVIMASEVGVLRDRAGERQGQRPLAAGPHVPGRFRAGPPDSRRGAEARFCQPPAVCASGSPSSASSLNDLEPDEEPHGFDPKTLLERMQAFGYTIETMQFMLLPLVRELRDPVGSMGNDSCLACLSDKPRMLYDYFKQLFAQVTNPAIDSIREEVIMSLECYIGPERNLLETTPEHAERLRDAASDSVERAAGRAQAHGPSRLEDQGHRHHLGPQRRARAGWPRRSIASAPKPSWRSTRAIRSSFCRIARSGRTACRCQSLLATGAVHHHLVRRTKRTRIGIVVETGEAREVHHHCLLVGYGADAINPYLAFEALWHARREGLISRPEGAGAKGDEGGEGKAHPAIEAGADGELIDPVTKEDHDLVYAYRKGVAKGMLKVMAKMGISTLQSYKGAQIFEAVGLARRGDRPLLRRHRQPHSGRAASMCWPKKRCVAIRSAIPSRRPIGCRCCRTPASFIGGPKVSGTCGIRPRLPICKWPPATTASTPTSDLPSIRTTMRGPAALCAVCWSSSLARTAARFRSKR